MLETEIGAFHLAGIIPLNSQPMDFQFPWHDCLQPIAPNFLAIERAVLECATAGCNTIWIACPYGIQPLLRQRLGDTVQDPVWFSRAKYSRKPDTIKREIPIYYIPVHPKDQDKKDSIVWSILYGCLSLVKVCSKMSHWLVPNKYYVCFPNTVFPSQFVRKYREDIVKKRRFLISFNNKTMLDGELLSGTINNQDIKFLMKEFRNQATGLWDPNSPKRDGIYPTEKLSLDNRYSGRFLTIKDVFSKLLTEEDTKVMTVDWHYPIDSWDHLCLYLGSAERYEMKRPVRPLLKYKELKGIANESKQ